MNEQPLVWSHFTQRASALLVLFICIGSLLASCAHSNKSSSTHIDTTALRTADLICTNANQYAGKVVGDGHCVSLIKRCAQAPSTKAWRPGDRVLANDAQLSSGSIIATFKNDRYPNKTGWHAAIYISHNEDGIWVWDQWKGKAVHKRFIRYRHDNALASNSAQDYRVVKLNINR